tara:strand:+ start:36 stop:242 length:207 start_codon:yes stop_codon:yes gene_type:complete
LRAEHKPVHFACLEKHKDILVLGGAMADICRGDVYVRKMEHFDAVYRVGAEYSVPPLPASKIARLHTV